MSALDTSPPAFPLAVPGDCMMEPSWGMSLRDYFAVHCDQPGTAEIITAAGLSLKSPAGVFVVFPDGSEKTFSEWWNEMSQAERFGLYAKVRFDLADAMLRQRMGEVK